MATLQATYLFLKFAYIFLKLPLFPVTGVMIGYQQGAAHLAAGPQGLTGLKSTLTNPDGSQCSTQENGKEMNEIEAPKVNNPETINPNEVSSSKGM